MEPAIWTPGVACRMSRTFCATASVRSSDDAVRQLHDDEEIALILDRQEGRGERPRQHIGAADAQRRTRRPAPSEANELPHRARIDVRRASKPALNQRNSDESPLRADARRNAALSAGLSVSELKAEMPTEIATVSANWL